MVEIQLFIYLKDIPIRVPKSVQKCAYFRNTIVKKVYRETNAL